MKIRKNEYEIKKQNVLILFPKNKHITRLSIKDRANHPSNLIIK